MTSLPKRQPPCAGEFFNLHPAPVPPPAEPMARR